MIKLRFWEKTEVLSKILPKVDQKSTSMGDSHFIIKLICCTNSTMHVTTDLLWSNAVDLILRASTLQVTYAVISVKRWYASYSDPTNEGWNFFERHFHVH